MRITHVIPYMHPNAGGPPVVVDRVCHRLAGRGYDVRVITTDLMDDGGSPNWRDSLSHRYKLEIFPKPRALHYFAGSPLAAAIDEAVKQSDLVHLHTLWTYPTFAASRACRNRRVPYVCMPHGMIDPHSLRRKSIRKSIYGRLIEWRTLRTAHGIIYTHREEQRLAESAVQGLPQGHIASLGTDESPPVGREALAGRFLSRHPHLQGRTIVVFLGRLHPKKGLDLLLPAFQIVNGRQPDAHLLLIGPGEERYVQSLGQTVGSLKLTDAVSFIGSLVGEAKWEALAASSVFVLPSYQENFALTVVEAMRLGLPIVLSRRVNIWDDVVSARAGVACELTADSIAECILGYLQHDDARSVAGKCGIQLVEDSFTWDSTVDAIELVYRQIVTNPSIAGRS